MVVIKRYWWKLWWWGVDAICCIGQPFTIIKRNQYSCCSCVCLGRGRKTHSCKRLLAYINPQQAVDSNSGLTALQAYPKRELQEVHVQANNTAESWQNPVWFKLKWHSLNNCNAMHTNTHKSVLLDSMTLKEGEGITKETPIHRTNVFSSYWDLGVMSFNSLLFWKSNWVLSPKLRPSMTVKKENKKIIVIFPSILLGL